MKVILTLTPLSLRSVKVVSTPFFLMTCAKGASPEGLPTRKEPTVLATQDDLLIDLTFHNVSASLLIEFAEKIVQPYYAGNMNAAIQDLLRKALAEQDFLLSHITHVRSVET